MTLDELRARYRTAAHDKAAPYFVTDDELRLFFNEAEREAAIRGRLIHDAGIVVAVKGGKAVYPLGSGLYELTHVSFRADGSQRYPISIVSTEWLDGHVRNWRSLDCNAQYLIQNDKSVRLVPNPQVAGTLYLEGYRLPKSDMEDGSDEPEIGQAHHIHLVQWALYRAFSIPDTEFIDPARAAAAEDEFTRYFGIRPDSDLRRVTREDVPQHVEAFWP